MALREYFKLARSFNAVLTGVSPVMGAIAMKEFEILPLFLLFIVGFFGHSYGFILNDILDFKIDKTSREIKDRPLLSGETTLKKAYVYALLSLSFSIIAGLYIANRTQNYYPVIILLISAVFITIYNLVSKRLPLMDIFVALGIFSLILYGASTVSTSIYNISFLAWMVCILGTIQVLYMQIVAGGMKDIKNDFERGANTFAVKTGVRIVDGKLKTPLSFKIVAYLIQLFDAFFVFYTIYYVWGINKLEIFHILAILALFLVIILMIILSYKLLSMNEFNRDKARRLIGSHYMINFSIVPIMLVFLNPWSAILVFFPALGFIMSNLVLHGTFLQPKTM